METAKEQMENNKDNVVFKDIYEATLKKILFTLPFDNKLVEKLKEKRDYGLEKYKENSFQGSFENAMKSPVYKHAVEECIDLINYLLHIIFINNVQLKNCDKVVENIKKVHEVYKFLDEEKK